MTCDVTVLDIAKVHAVIAFVDTWVKSRSSEVTAVARERITSVETSCVIQRRQESSGNIYIYGSIRVPETTGTLTYWNTSALAGTWQPLETFETMSNRNRNSLYYTCTSLYRIYLGLSSSPTMTLTCWCRCNHRRRSSRWDILSVQSHINLSRSYRRYNRNPKHKQHST